MPLLRAALEDFEVAEIPLYAPTGEGPHTLLLIEKRGVDTETVARALARRLGVRAAAVGFAGRKDRLAVARQWFSVPGLDPKAALELELDPERRSVRVLEAHPSRHKLRLGELAGNHFAIRVREVARQEAAAAEQRFALLCERGFRNRFGRQRFGRQGDNPARGAALLRGELSVRARRLARFLVSALQSAVFNRLLEERAAPIGALRPGEVAIVHASGGLFRVGDPESEAPRLQAFEVSPTGPMFGAKMLEPRGLALEEEHRALAAFGLPPSHELRVPRGLALTGGRRALRARVHEGSLTPLEDGLELRFVLDPGSYATVLVEELFPGVAVRDAPAERVPVRGPRPENMAIGGNDTHHFWS